jgi:lipopolysaccharide/colanic/teichoic acid biosynthesis glycosyltransferase
MNNGKNNENEEKSEVSENMEENISLAKDKLEEDNVESVESEASIEESDKFENEDIINEEVKEPSLLKKLFSNILDQSLIIALSSILLIIFDFLIKFVGYMVVMPLGVLLIIYFIVNSLYSPILKNTRIKKTLGEKIFNI